jgi:hypothetical protein
MSDLLPIMNWLRRLADIRIRSSVASELRRRRFQIFTSLLSNVPTATLRILDVGGTLDFWARTGFLAENRRVEITILNIFNAESPYPHVRCIAGDGSDMREFADREFDVVFSNSVIEHVGGLARQRRMAAEVRRLGNAYYLQTPNLFFPIEPHFLFPFFQFLPAAIRAFLLKHFRVGWYGPTNDAARARNLVTSVRLLGKRELRRLFPDGQVHREKVAGLTKSLVVVRPWAPERQKQPGSSSPASESSPPRGPDRSA